MVHYTTRILKFAEQGEKTGWTYFVVPADVAQQLKPGNKQSFRVKGKLDNFPVKQLALIPMGDGEFIIPFNADLRRGTGKRRGAMLDVYIEVDTSAFIFNKNFMACLKDVPDALKYFKTLPPGHQRYYSKWIADAKTEATQTKRIVMALNALERGMRFMEMLREYKAKKNSSPASPH